MFPREIARSITYLWSRIVGTVYTLWSFWKNINGKQIAHYEEVEETAVQPEASTDQEHGDTVDFLVDGTLKEALEKVSMAIYQVSIAPWHNPPEALKDQPLYKKISSVIEDTFFNIKRKARPMEEYEIIICIASGLIDHLKNVREKKMTYKYNTPQKEVDLLRKHTECLLKYWLPESLTVSTFTLDFLTQILSINALEPTFNNLANDTFLNQLIVMTLGNEETCEQRTQNEVIEDASFTPPAVSNTNMESDNIRKKKKKGFLKKIKGVLKNRKSKTDSSFRALSEGLDEDTTYSGDDVTDMLADVDTDIACSAVANQTIPVSMAAKIGKKKKNDYQDTDDDDDDIDNFNTSIIKTLIHKWKEENWSATVCKNRAKEDEYKICVSKGNNELWVTERSEQDFISLHKEICTKFDDVFKSITTEDPPSSIDMPCFYTINVTPHKFLETLLDLIKTHEEPEAAFFLSPFKYGMKERELFFTTIPDNDTQEDLEDLVTGNFNAVCEPIADDYDTVSSCDGFRMFQSSKTKKKHKKNKKAYDDDSSAVSESNEPFPSENSESRTKNPSSKHQKGVDVTGYNDKQTKNHMNRKTLERPRQPLQDTLLDVVYHLADELFAGGANRVRFLHTIGYLDKRSTELLHYISNMCTQKQIEQYLSQISEFLLSGSCPLQLTPSELQANALDLLEKTLKSFLPHTYFNFLFEKNILKHLKESHKSIQNSKANKETIFGLLENLTKIITDEKREPGSR